MRPILIVDDSADDRSFARRVFAGCDILNPILLQSCGQECLDYFEDSAAEDLPALVMMDLDMPVLRGVKVIRQLSSTREGAKSIFVMVSGLENIKEIREGYEAGARTFIVKPLQAEDVMVLVKGLKEIGVAEEKDGYILSQR